MSAPKTGKWIQGAISHKGSFTKAANRAGMSTAQYAKHVLANGSNASATTKKRAVLAQTLSKMRKK